MAALSLFLIGNPQSGKSSIFEALTSTPQGPQFVTKGLHRIGSVKVPNVELDALRTMYKPKKFTPAEVTFVDVALPNTSDDSNRLSQLTSFLGEADAYILVLQAFGEMDHRGQPIDLAQQLESVLLELIVSDLEKIEKRQERIAKEIKRGTKSKSDIEILVLNKCQEMLEEGKALRNLQLREDEEAVIKNFAFLSMKPVLVVTNIDESQLGESQRSHALEKMVNDQSLEILYFCAPLESDIAQMDEEEQQVYLQDYGLAEPARIRLIQTAYKLLELISFFTVGEDEVRAWTIRSQTTAQEAAGKIHSDIQRGFIRAETVSSRLLLQAGSWSTCRENANLKLEGKEYQVQSGDVINFRFSV